MERAVVERAARIRLLTCDVDGVLTDGRIYVDDEGRELKAYNALDGQGIKLLMRAGIAVAWITGSNAPSVRHRARHLGVEHVLTGVEEKHRPWLALTRTLGTPLDACAHAGDDLQDIPILAQCGLALTVPHACDAVKRQAHYVTHRDGGSGAVREIAEMLLAAQGRLDEAEALHGAPPPEG